MSDATATKAKKEKKPAAGGGRSAATGVKIGKGAARAIGKNAECVDEVLGIFELARKATVPWTPLQITQSLELDALQLARVTRSTGCGRLEVTTRQRAVLANGNRADQELAYQLNFCADGRFPEER